MESNRRNEKRGNRMPLQIIARIDRLTGQRNVSYNIRNHCYSSRGPRKIYFILQ